MENSGDAKAMLVVGDLNALNDEARWDRLDAIHEENGWAPPEDSSVPGGALHTFLENPYASHRPVAAPLLSLSLPVSRCFSRTVLPTCPTNAKL